MINNITSAELEHKLTASFNNRLQYLEFNLGNLNSDMEKESLLAYQTGKEISAIHSFLSSQQQNHKTYLDTLNNLDHNIISSLNAKDDIKDHELNIILDKYLEHHIDYSIYELNEEYQTHIDNELAIDYDNDGLKLIEEFQRKQENVSRFADKLNTDQDFKDILIKSRELQISWMENNNTSHLLNDFSGLIKQVPIDRLNEESPLVLNSIINLKQSTLDPDLKETIQNVITNYKTNESIVEDKLRYTSFYTDDFYDKNKGLLSNDLMKSIFIEIHLENKKKINNAKGEALNTPNHLKTNKMDTTNQKKETVTLSGNIGSISELKGTDKKFADVSIAVNKPGEPADFRNVRLWEDTKGINDHTAKVGDFIKVEGYEKTLKNSKEEDYTVFNVTAITEFKPKETIKLTGNLGSDPEFKEVKGKPVATISIAVKGADGVTEWKRIQMWEEKADAAKGLKKGDTVTVEGKEGKEYSYKKGEETLTTKDIVASVVEKHEKKSKEELNKDLISHAQKGDWEKVSDTLKKGADSKMVTEDHLKDLSPKQQDAIKNTIRSHEDFVAKKEGEKKNSSMKM